ncbi:hypothetical protein [Streptomyces sp. AK02-01A]|uniref:hypothetical protein n=1 Tax=Streptomyces sp. AK02-01A TaxID=3028648 RepID=UPI0029B492EE|nr:hypothetical protein [Streptomyces sp. AK02-01A]MDX3855923.1 hypothetical protein [Streptomyces sp. AK02-01A]
MQRLDFRAFRELHHGPYLRYAEARTPDTESASRAVEAAFTEIAQTWKETLLSPNSVATAWRILHHAVVGHADCVMIPAPSSDCAPANTPEDAVVLHRRLNLPLHQAAELMGIDTSEMCMLLRMADRGLPSPTTASTHKGSRHR